MWHLVLPLLQGKKGIVNGYSVNMHALSENWLIQKGPSKLALNGFLFK